MKRKSKKINPRRRPVNEADLRRAKNDAMSFSVSYAWAIIFTALRDKMCVSDEFLQELWGHVNNLSEAVGEGRVSIADLVVALREESGIELK